MSMRPGVNVYSTAISNTSGPPTDTGTWFAVGVTERGPLVIPSIPPTPVRSMADFVRLYGDRVAYGTLYDAIDTFFRVGGRQVYVSRVVGPAASVATLVLNDRAGSPLQTLRVNAKSPGDWGQRVTVSVANGSVSNTFVLSVLFDAVLVEQSPDLASVTEAVAWSTASAYIDVVDLASATASPNNQPAVIVATALAGGSDDRASITDTHWTLALSKFVRELGPGQVSQPGRTSSAAHLATISHAIDANRTAFLDAPVGSSVGTATILAGTIRGGTTNPEYGALFGPWVKVPGVVAGTTRLVPPSAIAAGLVARQDAVSNCNVPAAGKNGIVNYALDVEKTFTDPERQTLNDAGVCIFKPVFGRVELYGYRTLQIGPWQLLSNQRLRMQLVNESLIIAENYPFQQIDGRGKKIAEFNGDLKGMLQRYYLLDALFGETPEEAFDVDTGSAVNTVDTIAAGQLNATLSLRMSPFAEMVNVTIVKYPLTESLTA